MGVFYHLRYPWLALDTVARVKPRLMVFQTLTTGSDAVSPAAAADVDYATRERLEESGWPKMAFIERTFCKDPTNWWVPNHAAVVALLRSAGFKITAQPGHEIYLCEIATKPAPCPPDRSEEHTSELQSLMRISYDVFCLKKKTTTNHTSYNHIESI